MAKRSKGLNKSKASAMSGVFRMTDAMWTRLKPLIPKRKNTHRFGGGRPPADDRKCLDAIFYRLRTGCQWKALDATGICPGSGVHGSRPLPTMDQSGRVPPILGGGSA